MKTIFYLIALVAWTELSAQNCIIHPNTSDLIWNNNVHKQVLTVEEKGGAKYVLEVFFFDTTGNCYKRVYRDSYSKKYYFHEWDNGRTPNIRWTIFGYYDKDSNEVINDKSTTYYYPEGSSKLERLYRSDSVYHTQITIQLPDKNGIRPKPEQYWLDAKGDTFRKVYFIEKENSSSYVQEVKKGTRWSEEQKTVQLRDEKGNLVRSEVYKNGKRERLTTWKYVYKDNILTEAFEYNGEDDLRTKTIYFRDGYMTINYKNGKEENRYTEYYPVADPIPEPHDPVIIIDPEDGQLTNKKDREKPVKAEIPQRKKPVLSPRREEVKSMYDPNGPILAILEFGTDGLIIRENILWDNKTYFYSYEFY
ncbi:MAG TPA: hypothetical protein VI731_08300 [Bacteroidia bacterium]|nr:hypothetical protein [Bacteroidia bacterium]